MENKKCEFCGTVFTCLHSEKCWCLNYTVSKELTEYLKNKFENCLCEACLKHHVENEKKILSDK